MKMLKFPRGGVNHRYYLTLWSFLVVVLYLLAIKISSKNLDFVNISLHLTTLVLWISFLFVSYRKNHASMAIAYYLLFLFLILADRSVFGRVFGLTAFSYTLFLITISVLNIYIYQFANRTNLSRYASVFTAILFLIISFVPLLFVSYKIGFGVPLQSEELFAIFQTNANESVEFVFDFVPISSVLFFLGSIALLFYIAWWHKDSKVLPIGRKKAAIFVATTAILTVVFATNMKLPKYVWESKERYFTELQAFRDLQAKRATNPVIASKKEGGETYIIIIGESLNKNHMQTYGYGRDTTPRLQALVEEKQILKIENAFSNHTHTMPVLSLALTEAAQDGAKNYFNSASIVEIYKSAGFETVWITNQNLLGAWDNLVAIVANQSDKIYALNRSIGKTTQTQNYDGVVLPIIEKELGKKQSKNRAIFVHLMGSHGGYCQRFPSEFKLFKGELEMAVFGKKIADDQSLKGTVNCYDNSVIYNDFVVSSIVEMVAKRGGTSSILYFADHADDVLNKLGHNSGKFTFDMTQVPMIFWFSDDFGKKYSHIVESLSQNADQFFSNDRIYDTLIGLSGIKTDLYRKEFDLSSPNYLIRDDELVTLHGKKDYKEPSNKFYWQKKNLSYLQNLGLSDKYFPHRVNSVGKLRDLWNLGFRSFEIDVVFDYHKDGKFAMGHNHPLIGGGVGGVSKLY